MRAREQFKVLRHFVNFEFVVAVQVGICWARHSLAGDQTDVISSAKNRVKCAIDNFFLFRAGGILRGVWYFPLFS